MATRQREKAAARRANADKRPRAHLRYLRVSARRVRLVIDLIRDKNVNDAQAILMSTNKGTAPVIEKLLLSAVANAENNLGLNRQDLRVAECYVNDGPILRRMRARARGVPRPIMKRTCHISIILDQVK